MRLGKVQTRGPNHLQQKAKQKKERLRRRMHFALPHYWSLRNATFCRHKGPNLVNLAILGHRILFRSSSWLIRYPSVFPCIVGPTKCASCLILLDTLGYLLDALIQPSICPWIRDEECYFCLAAEIKEEEVEENANKETESPPEEEEAGGKPMSTKCTLHPHFIDN